MSYKYDEFIVFKNMPSRNFLICIFIYLVVTINLTSCQESSDRDKFIQRLDSEIPRLLTENMVPGTAIALIQGHQICFVKGYGWADKSKNKPVTEQTGFNIGSISKTVAAWGAMKLAENGKIDLDKPVEKYLTRWQLPPSEFKSEGVTLRRLLSHTAGLSLHGYPGWGPEDELPTIEQSLSGQTNGSGDVRLIVEPGTSWKYSGGGYTITQLLIEELSGMSFADYMRSEVLKPLKMENSDYTLTDKILAGSAVAYDSWGNVTPNPRFTAQAAAGLHTTVMDLAVFAMAAMTGSDSEPIGRNVLKPETISLMLTPAEASDSSYGLGYSIKKLQDGKRCYGHGGSNRGWQSYFQIIPETGDGIVILTNGSNGWAVLSPISDAWTEWITGLDLIDKFVPPIDIILRKYLKNNGINAAINQYWYLKNQRPDDYDFSENRLNSLGYDLININRIQDAISIFKLNTDLFPDSFNPWDSLGEAYMINGDFNLAIESYQKSLELNPDNTNALEMIRKMQDQN